MDRSEGNDAVFKGTERHSQLISNVELCQCCPEQQAYKEPMRFFSSGYQTASDIVNLLIRSGVEHHEVIPGRQRGEYFRLFNRSLPCTDPYVRKSGKSIYRFEAFYVVRRIGIQQYAGNIKTILWTALHLTGSTIFILMILRKKSRRRSPLFRITSVQASWEWLSGR